MCVCYIVDATLDTLQPWAVNFEGTAMADVKLFSLTLHNDIIVYCLPCRKHCVTYSTRRNTNLTVRRKKTNPRSRVILWKIFYFFPLVKIKYDFTKLRFRKWLLTRMHANATCVASVDKRAPRTVWYLFCYENEGFNLLRFLLKNRKNVITAIITIRRRCMYTDASQSILPIEPIV